MKKNIVFIIIIALSTSLAVGQEIKVDAEIRTRSEYRDGFRKPLPKSDDPSFVSNLRTKVNAFYASDEIKAKLSLIDTRSYGQTSTGSTGDGLGVLEAWGGYNFTPEFSFILGRQGLEYDDKRIFSYNNWSNTPGAHDLLLLKYIKTDLNVQAGFGYNNAGDSIQYLSPYKQTYKSLVFAHLEKNFALLSTSFIWVNDGHESGNTGDIKRTYRNTLGGYLWLTDKERAFNFLANAYYQFGRNKLNQTLHAYLLSLKIDQKIAKQWKLSTGIDFFSGSSSNIDANRDNTFNKLYGTNHAFNGSIEYWSTLPKQGLVDLHLGASASFGKKWNANLVLHHFSTSKEIKNNQSKNIGSEIDLTVDYIVNKELSVQGGWSCYFKNRSTDILKKEVDIAIRFPQWAYVQISFKPIFLNKR